MLLIARWLAVALGLWCVSCLDRKIGARGGAADADAVSDSSASDSAVPDTAVTDTAVAPDTGKPDLSACDPTLEVEKTGLVRFDDFGASFSPVVLDGTTLFGTRSEQRADGSYLRRIVAIDVAKETEQALPADEGEQLVLDGRDGVIAYLSIRGDYSLNALKYRDMKTGEVVELARGTEERRLTISPGPYAWDQGRRLVERGAAVWAEQANPYTAEAGPARVRLYRDGEIETLWESAALTDPPYLRAGRVTWVSWGDDGALWLKEPGRERVALAKGTIRNHTLTERAAWWIEEGRVMRYDFRSGERREVHEGPCNVLVADAEHAASVCGSAPDESGYAMARLGVPVVFGDDGATELTTRGGDLIAGLRVMGARVAWVEYPGSSGCYTGYGDLGELVVADLAAPTEPELLTTVGAGCWCCDAYWPALEIAMSERGLAWNYARGEPEDGTVRELLGSIGWALFGGCKR